MVECMCSWRRRTGLAKHLGERLVPGVDGRIGTIDKLRAHAVERTLTAARPASALADDSMRQLEEHLGVFAEGAGASKRSRLPLAGMSPGFVQVPARCVAPPALDLPEDDGVRCVRSAASDCATWHIRLGFASGCSHCVCALRALGAGAVRGTCP